jgi:8-oxo-dGTP pyrophosphatase MutT (NUDIX family)
MIRRNSKMRFLGGYYAFPGGKVDAADAAPESLARAKGFTVEAAERVFPGKDGIPALAFWVAALRELFEETGVLMATDQAGQPVDPQDPEVASRMERCRKALMAGERSLAELLAEEVWFFDLRPLRYLSHFITPAPSPIRFTARFFLSPLPPGQEPRISSEETSEGFWIGPREAYGRFRVGAMAMAEPAEYALGYLAQFDSYAAVWANHADGRHKFHGLVHRIEFYGRGYDWATATWKSDKPPWQP